MADGNYCWSSSSFWLALGRCHCLDVIASVCSVPVAGREKKKTNVFEGIEMKELG